jgi:hypothetical protein
MLEYERRRLKTTPRAQVDEVRPLVNVEDTVTDGRNGEKRKQQLFKVRLERGKGDRAFAQQSS